MIDRDYQSALNLKRYGGMFLKGQSVEYLKIITDMFCHVSQKITPMKRTRTCE